MHQTNFLGRFSPLTEWNIQKVCSYLDFHDLERLIQANSYFRNIILRVIKFSYFSASHALNGGSNQNDLYLQIKLPNYQIQKITGSVETKDQGWASVEHSNSWVELALMVQNQKLDISIKVAENFKNKNFRKIHFQICPKQHSEFYQRLPDATHIGVYARSLYPGWQCFIKSSKVKLFYTKFTMDVAENEVSLNEYLEKLEMKQVSQEQKPEIKEQKQPTKFEGQEKKNKKCVLF